MAAFIAKMNASVQNSFVGRFFLLEERGSNMTTELNGAFSTFMSMGEYNADLVFFIWCHHHVIGAMPMYIAITSNFLFLILAIM